MENDFLKSLESVTLSGIKFREMLDKIKRVELREKKVISFLKKLEPCLNIASIGELITSESDFTVKEKINIIKKK